MDFNNLKLNCWGDYVLYANVEEDVTDIDVAVLYTDHGDEYLVVRTKDGNQHEYGLYLNRKWAPDDPEDLDDDYIRKPVLYAKSDKQYSASNDAFFAIEDFSKENRSSWSPRKYGSEESAQWNFEYLLKKLEDIHAKGYFYDLEGKRNVVRTCLEENNIATSENIELLNNAKFSSKDENGVDGIAARKVDDEDMIWADSVNAVFHDGKWLDRSEYIMVEDDDPDEWGFTGMYFPMDQFNSSEKAKVIEEINSNINYVSAMLDDIKNELCDASFWTLYNANRILINTADEISSLNHYKGGSNEEAD